MRKIFLLSLCLLCACRSTTAEDPATFITVNDAPVIDATTDASSRCGADGISCNDTALINYTKTEADYRAYGERTKRDHLYTQAGAGSNLTATIPPELEEDIVTGAANPQDEVRYTKITRHDISSEAPIAEDGDVFAGTDGLNLEVNPDDFDVDGAVVSREDAINETGEPKNEIDRPSIVVASNSDDVYEIICEEDCDEANKPTETSSEFSEESFDIADYIEEQDLSDDDLKFTDIGESAETVTAEFDIKEIKIDDNTVLTWEANEGDTLRGLLTKWSSMAGWKLLWNTNRNYTLSASVMFKGKFADVSSALIRAFARARPAPIATFYKGNRVIVVETMENENAY
jgi:hypothetical protein